MLHSARGTGPTVVQVLWGLGLILGGATVVEAGPTYLALGDSVTFGVTSNDSATDISAGDRGYVKLYADYLGQVTGTRPNVVNLAISGETSSSFFGNGVGLGGPLASTRNTNYNASPSATQYDLMTATIKAQLASGNTISTVTMTLGANDLFQALANGTSFPTAFATLQTNEIAILTQIRKLLPSTNLLLLGYYDPYAPYLNATGDPRQPIAQASAMAIPLLNSLIASDAQAFQARFVDVYPVFQGKELADTYISTGNVHPNDVGYALIAGAIVPEPSSWVLLVIGCGVVPVLARCRFNGARRDSLSEPV